MKTHYEVLNLDKNCTAKEIKDSFIKLSKKFHPDLNKSSEAHKRFVEINEAYSVLGNTNSRHWYDASLPTLKGRTINQTSHSYERNPPYEFYADMYAGQRRRYNDIHAHRVNNVKGLLICCFIIILGSSLNAVAEVHRRAQRTHNIAKALREARDHTKRVGREQRIKELEEALSKKMNLKPSAVS